MSVSLGIRGVVEPTEEFHKKYVAYKACEDAAVEIPDELRGYFDWEEPNKSGLVVDISDVSEQKDGMVEIDLAKLRKDITKIQVYLSW